MKEKRKNYIRFKNLTGKSFIPLILSTLVIAVACTEGNLPVGNEMEPAEMEISMQKKSAPAGLVLNEFNGNYYQAVESIGITWDDANAAAQGLSYQSCQGHLASITSQNENDWVVANFPDAVNGGYWLGGKQSSDATAADEGWSWVSNENWLYTNWTNGEPNDFDGKDEESLHFSPGVYGAGDGFWNDQNTADVGFPDGSGGFVFSVGGYIVEYDCGAKVTGSGNRNGDLPQISLVAQKDANNNVKGQAQVKYPKGVGAFHVEVSCLSVWGNEAWIGGTITKSSFAPFPKGTEIVWAVADNGEGKDAEDFTSFYFYFPDGSPIAETCALQSGFIGSPLEFSSKGNIQIH